MCVCVCVCVCEQEREISFFFSLVSFFSFLVFPGTMQRQRQMQRQGKARQRRKPSAQDPTTPQEEERGPHTAQKVTCLGLKKAREQEPSNASTPLFFLTERDYVPSHFMCLVTRLQRRRARRKGSKRQDGRDDAAWPRHCSTRLDSVGLTPGVACE